MTPNATAMVTKQRCSHQHKPFNLLDKALQERVLTHVPHEKMLPVVSAVHIDAIHQVALVGELLRENNAPKAANTLCHTSFGQCMVVAPRVPTL